MIGRLLNTRTVAVAARPGHCDATRNVAVVDDNGPGNSPEPCRTSSVRSAAPRAMAPAWDDRDDAASEAIHGYIDSHQRGWIGFRVSRRPAVTMDYSPGTGLPGIHATDITPSFFGVQWLLSKRSRKRRANRAPKTVIVSHSCTCSELACLER